MCASGLVSPAAGLALGLVFGLGMTHPWQTESRTATKYLLQASVVGLGFGMNLHEVLRAGRSGFVYTAASIAFALTAGLLAGRMLGVNKTASILITVGTAICGGSAIAAVAPIIHADQEETAVSLGTVFILNAIALLIFPPLGWLLHLSQQQFGLWAALAIHDTSSVVGATARYGAVALVVGTTVKLTRALWIVPVSVGAAVMKRSDSRIQWPWFIALFCLAAVANTYLPRIFWCVACVERDGEIGIDGDFVFDWDGNFAGYGAAGGGASDVAGSDFVDFSGGYFVVVDTRGVDCVVRWRDSGARKNRRQRRKITAETRGCRER